MDGPCLHSIKNGNLIFTCKNQYHSEAHSTDLAVTCLEFHLSS